MFQASEKLYGSLFGVVVGAEIWPLPGPETLGSSSSLKRVPLGQPVIADTVASRRQRTRQGDAPSPEPTSTLGAAFSGSGEGSGAGAGALPSVV